MTTPRTRPPRTNMGFCIGMPLTVAMFRRAGSPGAHTSLPSAGRTRTHLRRGICLRRMRRFSRKPRQPLETALVALEGDDRVFSEALDHGCPFKAARAHNRLLGERGLLIGG